VSGSASPSAREASWAAWGLGLVFSLWYALAAEPMVGWFDAGELHAAALELAPSHAPGQPLWSFLGKTASLLPLGPAAMRLSLVAAAAGVTAVVALFWLVLALVGATDPEMSPRLRVALAAGCAGAFGCLSSAVAQALRAEVYMGAAALSLSAAALVARATFGRAAGSHGADPFLQALLQAPLHPSTAPRAPVGSDRNVTRLLSLGALLTAAAATIHPAMAVCAAVPFAVTALAAGGPAARASRTVAPALTVVVGGATLYLLIAFRAWEPHAWGGGDGWAAWLFHVRAGGYAGNVSPANLPGNLRPMATFFLAAAGPMAIASVVGLAAVAQLRRVGPIAFLWSLLLVVSAFAGMVNTPMEGNPDAQGYVLVGMAALCALPGVCAGALAPLLARLRVRASDASLASVAVLGLFAVVTAVAQIVIPVPMPAHPGWAPREYGAALLDATPPRGILLTHGDHEVFPPIFLQGVEAARPDVAVVAAGLLSSQWYLQGLKKYYPWLTVPVVDAPTPPPAGEDYRDQIHRGLVDDNPGRQVTAADSVFPVPLEGSPDHVYKRVPLRRMIDALAPALPYVTVGPDDPRGIPPGTWRGDALVVERALYDVAVRAVTEGEPRAVQMLAVLCGLPEPAPEVRPDVHKLLNARVDRLNSAFLYMREIGLGAYGDALHAAGMHEEADRVLLMAGEHGLRAVWEGRLGHLEKVREALDAAEVAGGDASAFAVLAGDVAAEDGHPDLAVELFREAASRAVTDAVPLLRIGVLRGNAGALDEAKKAFEDAIARDVSASEPHVMLGLIHAKQGDLAGAKAEFDKALAIDPENTRAAALLKKSDDELKTAGLEE
jgi:hypothetical protein